MDDLGADTRVAVCAEPVPHRGVAHVPPVLEADHDARSGLGGGVEDGTRVADLGRERLLDHEVEPGAGTEHGGVAMREVRGGDDHGSQFGVAASSSSVEEYPGTPSWSTIVDRTAWAAVADRHELGVGILLERPGEHAAADSRRDDSDSC